MNEKFVKPDVHYRYLHKECLDTSFLFRIWSIALLTNFINNNNDNDNNKILEKKKNVRYPVSHVNTISCT